MTNRTSPIKRRRTQADMAELRAGLLELVRVHAPVTCRQAFYLAVAAGLVEKTEGQYNATVCRLLADLRRDGSLPWHHMVDFTRTVRRPATWNGLADLLHDTARFYRRAVWRDLAVRVEVWTEKETLTGVLNDLTSDFDVPLMPTRGYPSLTFLHAAAEEISAADKPTWIYYFGDHDPTGVDIPRKVEAELRNFAPEAEIHFERVAVLPHQILLWELPTRPTKTTDSRAKYFTGESVEIEAIAPDQLRALCREVIERHLPDGAMDVLHVAEESERHQLQMWADYAEV